MKRKWIILLFVLMGIILCSGIGTGWFGLENKEVQTTALCPVCQRIVLITEITLRFEYKGKVYYFNNSDHQKIFMDNPEKFSK